MNLYQKNKQYHTELKEQLLRKSVKIIVIENKISEFHAQLSSLMCSEDIFYLIRETKVHLQKSS